MRAEASTVHPRAPASDEEQLRDEGASSLLPSRACGTLNDAQFASAMDDEHS
jgi:hypothetical protein